MQVFELTQYPIITTPYEVIIERPAFTWMIISGAILALVGGLIARPRYLWPVLIVSGTAYSILALIDIFKVYLSLGILGSSPIILLVGIVCVIEGLLVHRFRKRLSLKASL